MSLVITNLITATPQAIPEIATDIGLLWFAVIIISMIVVFAFIKWRDNKKQKTINHEKSNKQIAAEKKKLDTISCPSQQEIVKKKTFKKVKQRKKYLRNNKCFYDDGWGDDDQFVVDYEPHTDHRILHEVHTDPELNDGSFTQIRRVYNGNYALDKSDHLISNENTSYLDSTKSSTTINNNHNGEKYDDRDYYETDYDNND